MSQRAIIHVDMDAFYASVEVLDHPEYAGRPVIVGGTPEGRGVVAAASYEARKFGVHSAMSAHEARRLCPQGVFLIPRMERYAAVSREVFTVFEDYTARIEPVSIDEAYLDVTAHPREATDIGREIKRRIREKTKLAASVGVAPNKFLAKLASDLSKPDGFKVITAAEAPALLAGLPVKRLWGVGPAGERLLAGLGIKTIGELGRYPRRRLAEVMDSFTDRLLELSRGVDEDPVVAHAEPKSLGAETTFATDIGDAAELRRQLDALAARVARELRESGYRARTVHLKARFPDFSTVTRAITLAEATDLTGTLRDAARQLLDERLDRAGRPLRLIGVSVSGMIRAETEQMRLFVDEDRKKDDRAERFDRAADELRREFGGAAPRPASQLIPEQRNESVPAKPPKRQA